jgi:hypothetical protein
MRNSEIGVLLNGQWKGKRGTLHQRVGWLLLERETRHERSNDWANFKKAAGMDAKS